MAHARRRSFPQARSKRAPTAWSRTITPAPFTVAPVTKILVTSLVLSNPGIRETILRTRGLMGVLSDQSLAPEDQVGAWGIVRVTDIALAAGAAFISGPITERNDDGWLIWQPFMASRNATTLEMTTFPFDSKAMRIIEEGFALAVMVENASPDFGFDFALAASLLFASGT